MQFLLPLLTLISLSLLCGVKGWSPTNYEQFPINSLSSSLSLTKLGIGRPTNDIVSISSRRRWWNRNTSKTTRSKTKTRMLFNNNINKGNSLQQATKKTSSSSSSVAAERRVLTVVKSNLFSNRVTSSKRTTTTTTMLSSSATSTLQDGQNGQSSVKTLSKVPAAFVKVSARKDFKRERENAHSQTKTHQSCRLTTFSLLTVKKNNPQKLNTTIILTPSKNNRNKKQKLGGDDGVYCQHVRGIAIDVTSNLLTP